ncbi:hypothetical protein ACVIGA_000058 [Bradyrhizobium sp. USDA 3240]
MSLVLRPSNLISCIHCGPAGTIFPGTGRANSKPVAAFISR